MRLIKYCFLLVLFISVYSYALSSDRLQPYHIQSDRVNFNRSKNIARYEGNVKVTQGTSTLTADKLIMYFMDKNSQIKKMIATGNLAHYSTLPDGKKQKMFAQANIIIYYPQENKIILKEHAKVTQEHYLLSSNKITYNIKQQSMSSNDQGGHHQTTIIIPPKALQ